MDKQTDYQNLIKNTIRKHAGFFRREDETDVQTQIIFDDERGHYQWITLGWENGRKRAFYTHLYIRLHNGKIWIEKDSTEYGAASDFLENGVPHEDIVLAFRAPEMRELGEFAVA